MLKRKVALAGNRTPDSRVAGGNSTTEPPMPVTSTLYPAQSHIKYCIHAKKQNLHLRGIEPRPPTWQAKILPLKHQCLSG